MAASHADAPWRALADEEDLKRDKAAAAAKEQHQQLQQRLQHQYVHADDEAEASRIAAQYRVTCGIDTRNAAASSKGVREMQDAGGGDHSAVPMVDDRLSASLF